MEIIVGLDECILWRCWRDTPGYDVQTKEVIMKSGTPAGWRRTGAGWFGMQRRTFPQGNLVTVEPQRKDIEENMVASSLWCPHRVG